MCDVCCRELRGWCRAFTKTEIFLTVLEAILLTIFIAFLTFVVLHFIACTKKEIYESTYPGQVEEDGTQDETSELVTISPHHPTSSPRGMFRGTVKCTWKAKQKTEAVTHYYEQKEGTEVLQSTQSTRAAEPASSASSVRPGLVADLLPTLPDGDDAAEHEQHALALVKVHPPQDVLFGCFLTIVADYWAVTAASCIEAIEEMDSLDSFVMMEHYGERPPGPTHAVADVLMHPWYQGTNSTYDFVALKSEDSLVAGSKRPIEFSSLLDYFLMPVGEKLTILGYGKYRSAEPSAAGRRLRQVSVRALAPAQCAAAAGWAEVGGAAAGWAPRHLARPHALAARGCGARVLCAGPLAARGAPCQYCAGTPLLRGRRLLAVMSDNAQCGVACEPALYAAAALLRDWLRAQLAGGELAA